VTTPRVASSTATVAERPAYKLAHDPDGRAWTARENLVDVLERELLGPLNGPDEVIDGSPDSVYLIGRIAPVKLAPGKSDPTDAATGEADTDVGDATDAELSRGVPTTAVDDTNADDEDSGIEDEPQRRGLMIPASMGLRCQVPDDLESITVTASWGVYESINEEREDTGRSIRKYKRTPIEIPKRIMLADLRDGTTFEVPLKDKVVLRIDRYDDPERGCCLIEIALCNDRETERKIPVSAWLYQTKLTVTADRPDAFLPSSDPLLDTRPEHDREVLRLNLQYRDRLEFAVGRTCSVDWEQAEHARRATKIWTTWLPTCETPQVTAEEIDALLDMRKLATANPIELRDGLAPIVERYEEWLDAEEAKAQQLPAHLQEAGLEAVADARKVHQQLADGLVHLLTDQEALRCFRFMNQVMADQRVQSQVARRRAQDPDESIDDARAAVLAQPRSPHSWFTFQLAFILMQLPLLTNPAAAKRSGNLSTAQLLFFPTGGGKTEAYLGLAAYAFAIRRRQPTIETIDGQLDGRDGVTVLMRYTLRLLTSQQFQRATALVCAAEMARRQDEDTWGKEPFRIGLWVGTDVSPKRFEEAESQQKKASAGGGYRLTVLQVQRCPWCGSKIDVRNLRPDPRDRRIYVYCGDELADCPFAEGGEAKEGLPILTVDEEIYRLAPAFVIATVDKFARLAREGEASSLFGQVSRRCERHGYVHPDYKHCDLKDGSKHPETKEPNPKDRLPAAAVRSVTRLRPPDLIIQDELHLITGALGTTVGLFEVAIDALTTWRTAADRPVRPLLVASTATARNAHEQVRALYGRSVSIFPPPVLDAGRTFFSREEPVTEKHPGRRYIGISTSGIRLTTAEIRISEVLLAAGQLLLDRSADADAIQSSPGSDADPYMTLVGYFSATRELAGLARYMGDDIQTALAKGWPWSRLPRRSGTDYGALRMAELTSRVASADITGTLDQMAVPFDPAFDSTAGRRALAAMRQAGKTPPERDVAPFDVVLATSMLQVGVDVTRLGLMLVVGQPKNTAEYIQASSRVGRDRDKPGLVVALGNWARPRDLAHFEQFRHYHETFYSQVEALSVTPFSVTSLERGLDGVLVSVARVLQAGRAGVATGLSPEHGASRIDEQRDFAARLIDALVTRVGRAAEESDADNARQHLINRLDRWVDQRERVTNLRKTLVYERVTDESKFDSLMMSPENARAVAGDLGTPPFVVANSMREVQPEINLLVSPIEGRLVYTAPPGSPGWEFRPEGAS
jgi:hypothetical protein